MKEVSILNNLEPRPINELLKEDFYIPSYQRGYRWTTKQVEALLKDVLDFFKNSNKDEFYCLQPVVVKKVVVKGKEKYEVIDGQQRLTTIFIILNYFNLRLAEEYKKKLFTIDYQTRTESQEFLEEMKLEKRNKNIDFFFMSNAYETVKNWFVDKQNYTNSFEETLLNQVEVIWYEVKDDDQEIDIFTRLNMGKIPLTNAELIKALFLKRDNFIEGKDIKVNSNETYLKQIEIATQWDAIEKKFNDPKFWYFIKDDDIEYDTRIEFLFDKMSDKKKGNDDYFTFQNFNNKLNPKYDSEVWEEVKSYFLNFEEWFNDFELYHLVGFLIQSGAKISQLIEYKAEAKSKSAFKEKIKKEIKKKIPDNLDEVEYGRSNQKIKNVLLLFNIQTILTNAKENVRFPFDSYVANKWDLEHIRSIKDDVPANNIREAWTEDLIRFLENEGARFQNEREEERLKLVNSLKSILGNTSSDSFINIYNKVLQFFNEQKDDEDTDSIGNLTLLDSKTNRSYKNAVFPIKRMRIINNEKKGLFVPLCTKNVFLKFYAKNSNHLFFWEKEDIKDYSNEIKETLEGYIPLIKKIEDDEESGQE